MAYEMSEDDLSEFQELSNKYQPEATVRSMITELNPSRRATHLHNNLNPTLLTTSQGPLLGPKRSSNHITAEYETADPVYRTKTAV